MRYIITSSQLHNLIYKHLDLTFSKGDFRKEINPYVKDGKTWNVEMFDDQGENLISYYWYGPGEDDDGNIHNGVGVLQLDPKIVDPLRMMFKVRQNRIMDIIADWVSQKLDSDVDEIELYPNRNSTPNY